LKGSHRVLVTTVPFAESDPRPRALLSAAGICYDIQPLGRRLTEAELVDLAAPYTVLIAGTEPITANVMDAAPDLKLISRVGVGLDGVDLIAAQERDIIVSYTPDAPSPAVAELTVGLMLDLMRNVSPTDRLMRTGVWKREMGRRLAESTIGLIGVGRIGKRVVRILRGGFPEARLLACDLQPDLDFGKKYNVEWVDKDELCASSDVISLHVPLTPMTRGMIGAREFALMGPDALVVNTARGGVVVESELAEALRSGALKAAAVDVFEQEPYAGELTTLKNCLVTCHMGSMTIDCRSSMEMEATEEAVRFVRGEQLLQRVPDEEYHLRKDWT
jgi:D-3-phosphoglycerate dehydrogenase / 2-oxoglutarate reductase